MPQAALLELPTLFVSEPDCSGRIAEGLALAQHDACLTVVVARCVVDGLRGVGARIEALPTQETLNRYGCSIVPVTPVTPKRRDKISLCHTVVSHPRGGQNIVVSHPSHPSHPTEVF